MMSIFDRYVLNVKRKNFENLVIILFLFIEVVQILRRILCLKNNFKRHRKWTFLWTKHFSINFKATLVRILRSAISNLETKKGIFKKNFSN